MQTQPSVVEDLRAALRVEPTLQETRDEVPTIWVRSDEASRVLRHLKEGVIPTDVPALAVEFVKLRDVAIARIEVGIALDKKRH